MDTIVRLPDPSKAGDFLRDLASVQKLKKALGQAFRALDEQARGTVEAQFRIRSADQSIETILQKTTAVTTKEKEDLVWLTEKMSRHSAHVGLETHPGFADPQRPLEKDEAQMVGQAVEGIKAFVEGVGSGKYDSQIISVFGLAVMDEVKKRFNLSLAALLRIHKSEKILIDTMQKQNVWGCGGLTSETQIALPNTLKTVNEESLMLTLVHEMTHAMPELTRTSDKYYRHHERFKTAKEQRKLITADYYAEVFDRARKNVAGEVFLPVDHSEMSNQPGDLLKRYREEAQKFVNLAWAMTINIHNLLASVGKFAEANQSGRFVPTFFATELHTAEHIQLLSNVSRLLGLTIHKRNDLSGTTNQVTVLDLSIVDNKLNVMGRLQKSLGKTLTLPADVTSFDEAKVDPVLRMALKIENSGKERPGLLSKDIDKDIIVLRSLAKLNDAPLWAQWKSNLTKGLPEPMKSYAAVNVY